MLLTPPCLRTGLSRTMNPCSQSASLLTRLCTNAPTTISKQTLHSCRPCKAPLNTPRNSQRATKHVSHLYLQPMKTKYPATSRNCLMRTLPAVLPRKACQQSLLQQTVQGRRGNLHATSLRGQSWTQSNPPSSAQLSRRFIYVQSVNGGSPLTSGVSKRFVSSVASGLSYRCMSNVSTPQVLHRGMSTTRSGRQNAWQHRNKSVMLYVVAGAVLVVGFSYAAVPLYTVFCQATGLGGQATAGHDTEKVEFMVSAPERELTIRFNADTAASMRWNFRPQQSEVKVLPGETALAFYSAMNPTDKPIVGISTYNVVPFEAGQYFNKIQCFCFEEQRLNPHEQVDMPVFFYIDPEFVDDPKMEKVTNITLSYTFFESKEGLELPDPMSR